MSAKNQKKTVSSCRKKADKAGLIWFDPWESPLELSGFPWFDTDHVFRRLPVHPSHPLPEGVESLAWCTSGGKVRFKTDSGKVIIRVKLRYNEIMDHMPRTGSNGFDLYVGEPGREIYFQTTRSSDQEYEYQLFQQTEKKLQSITINFPLYNGVDLLQIGVEKDATVLSPEPLKKYVAVYGTSITQGGCASRPGMASTNILSRKLKRHFCNFGFSGSGRGEPEVAHVLAELDPVMFLLDFEANAWKDYNERLPEFIRILREAHPVTPIVVLSCYHYSIRCVAEESYRNGNSNGQSKLIEKLRKNGDRYIWSIDGRKQLGKYGPEATVDGVHATDLGFLLQAEFLLPHLRKLLAGKD